MTATASGTAAGSLTFDVTAVAAAHALVSAEAVGSTSAVVASGPLTLTTSAGTTQVDVGSGSLADVVAGINAAGKGVTATAVQTSPGQYRLQVTATSPGASSAFTLDGLDGFSAMNVLTTGADAVISIGSDPATAYQITSSSNTFSGVVPGLSFTVGQGRERRDRPVDDRRHPGRRPGEQARRRAEHRARRRSRPRPRTTRRRRPPAR